EGVILVAATNRPDVLDPALLRPGRFDRRIVVNRPDVKGREGILAVHTKKIPLSDDVDIAVLARGTSGHSGADLANLVNEAALNAARYNQKVVRMLDFEFAKDKVLMGAERRSMIISEAEKRITAIHESGHALLAVMLPHADPIHKVTIIPRGTALKIDHEVKRFVTDAFNRANEILLQHKPRLMEMAEALLVHETLDAEQVRRSMAGEALDLPTPAAAAPPQIAPTAPKPKERST